MSEKKVDDIAFAGFSFFVALAVIMCVIAINCVEHRTVNESEEVATSLDLKSCVMEFDGVSIDYSFYDSEVSKIIKSRGLDDFTLCDASEITVSDLENRKGVLVERVIGKVDKSDGGGTILNYEDKDYYYINYNNVSDFSVGDIYVTYLIYNPFGNEVDDIIERFDFKI